MRETAQQRAARDRLYASDAQVSYLSSLLHAAFAAGFAHGLRLDPHHLERVTRTEASAAIDRLVSAKARGWAA